jgi:hypothetical protein
VLFLAFKGLGFKGCRAPGSRSCFGGSLFFVSRVSLNLIIAILKEKNWSECL